MQVLGLSLEKNCLKTALLRREKKTILIEKLDLFFVESDVKPFYIPKFSIQQPPTIICTGLDHGEVLIRDLILKLKKKSSLLAALPFQAEAILPYPIDDAILAPFFYPLNPNETHVSLYATQKKHLETHLSNIQSYGIDPQFVSCTPRALISFAGWVAPQKEHLLIFHIGKQKSLCLLNSGNKIHLCKTLDMGTVYPSCKNAEETLLVKKELFRISSFIEKKLSSSESYSLLLTGDLESSFASEILERFSPLFPAVEIKRNPQFPHFESYAIPIGLALEQLNSKAPPLQLRIGAYQHPSEKKELKKKSYQFIGSCLFFAFSLWIAVISIIKSQEKKLFRQLEKISSFEFNAKNLEETIFHLENTLDKQKPSFPFALTVPKVSDFLVWLSELPHSKAFEDSDDKLEIKRVHYSLVKYPKLGQNRAPYEAKVELEFTTSSPKIARQFHNMLIAGEGPIHPKGKISWEASQNSYVTSFYLKRKGRAS